jgi:hypothetical protein
MDELTMTPDRRLHATRTYGRAAFDAAAWKAPEARRFTASTAANDVASGPSLAQELRDLPRWVVVVAGGAFSALLGVMMGAAFQL